RPGVAQPRRMVAVPMRLASRALAVVAKQDHAHRPSLGSHRDCTSPAIAERLERLGDQPNPPVKIVARIQRATEVPARFLDMPLPPLRVYRKQRVRPRRSAERGVYRDDAFRGRPRRFPPPSDGFAVVSGEAWSAGEADNGS